MIFYRKFLLLIAFFLFVSSSFAQTAGTRSAKDGIYVDRNGVIRWEKSNKEASFFGVNYTAPFAYGYRSIKRLDQSVEQAIRDDVYHFSRLGLDAFRVHVWDTEISDSLGNLINNEQLRLFDLLIAELKKRNIKTLVTPIAFWGNGYPEKDVNTGSFSSKYGKHRGLVEEAAFVAQERYLKQFFQHKNQYTGLTYQDDPDVLAAEVNNEPQHSGPKERATEYVNRMVKAIRSTGWSKPIFYNISESPKYADAIVKADVQGHTFQWYPTGLVAGYTLKGNYLPNVSRYPIPFDSIPGFNKRAKIVYEFDAGDILDSYMYPAMARSFRTAGFQWATQFAYDPMATAYANTEYQTHYLNLAYTPSKAISLLIASRVFHTVPRLKSFPTDTLFDAFRLNYNNSLSEMNTAGEFYYSNSTVSKPKLISKLHKIAGVGSSAVVAYKGSGAYFIDKLADGVWRLEVMPDAVHIRDPFEKASPAKEVTRINWESLSMAINLPDLGAGFTVKGINKDNSFSAVADGNTFNIAPGTYLLTGKGKNTGFAADSKYGVIALGEFVAPKALVTDPFATHTPYQEVTGGQDFTVSAQIAGLKATDSAYVELRNSSSQWKQIALKAQGLNQYSAVVPAGIVIPGVLSYRIIIRQANGNLLSFPGNHQGNPYAWDNYQNDFWQSYVAPKNAILEVFNPNIDKDRLILYNPEWKNNVIQYPSSEKPAQLMLRMMRNGLQGDSLMGFQTYIGQKLQGRASELAAFKTMVIRARSTEINAMKVKLGLIDKQTNFFAADVVLGHEFKDIEIPLSSLKPEAQLLLPRPYPGFLPLYHTVGHEKTFSLKDVEKLSLAFGFDPADLQFDKAHSLEIMSIYFK